MLLFDVLANDLDGCAAPQPLADARVVLLADHAAGHAGDSL